MSIINHIFNAYSAYSGTGILTVLFFVALIYVALKEQSRSNRTILLYGTVILMAVIFCPLTYYIYYSYVDATTYWRFFWLVPIGVGLAYVGTQIADRHRITGMLMATVVLILGGTFVYTSREDFRLAENPYQIPDAVIEMSDYMEAKGLDEIRVAVTPELLTYIRQYDVNLTMPYGREQLDPGWGEPVGFFQLMLSGYVDYEAIAEKCMYNATRFIIVNDEKQALNNPEDAGFKYCMTSGAFSLYEFTEL